MTRSLVRIGTRGSPLALWQANAVRDRIAAANGIDPERIELVVIRTTGDMIQDRPLSEAGGKGLFTKEIDQAVEDGAVQLAVHSAKDLPTALAPGQIVAACLPRADVRDALILREGESLDDLPAGAVVGTASLRRAALVLRQRPDLRTATLRGNVETRIRKLQAGEVDATLLALAGLTRLGLADRATAVLDSAVFPPALGQGTVAITARQDDAETLALLAAVDHRPSSVALACERAFLDELEGSCRMPIAGLAEVAGEELRFNGLVLSPDGAQAVPAQAAGPAAEAARLGREAGRDLKLRMPPGLLATVS